MQRTRSSLFLLALALGGAVAAVSAPAPAAAQTPRAKYRVNETVEGQQGDGRWYQCKIQRVKGTDEYLVRWVNFVNTPDAWVKEDKLRPAGSGEIVDPEYVKANFAMRAAFPEMDRLLGQARFDRDDWVADMRKRLDALQAEASAMAGRWPAEKAPPLMLEGVARRRGELEAKVAEAAAAKAGAAAAAGEVAAAAAQLEAFYKPIYEEARNGPYAIDAETMLDRAAFLEALDLAAIDARVAADKARHPELFKYYGAEQKGRYADLEWGGGKRPAFAHKTHEQLTVYWLPAIYEAKAKLAGKEGELARAAALALERAGTTAEAEEAVRLAKAVRRCAPGAPDIDATIAKAEARAKELAAAPAKPAKPAASASKPAPAAATRPAIDVAKIDSGVELWFSDQPAPGSPAVASFAPGSFIYAHAKFKGPIVRALTQPVVTDQVAFPLFLYLDADGRELDVPSLIVRTVHLFAESSAGDAGYLVVPVVSNPAEDCFVYANNTFNYRTWEQLAALPPGEHVIEARLDASAPKVEGVPLAVARLTVKIAPEGNEAWKKNGPEVFKALAQRGGEIVTIGFRAEGPRGWKIVVHEGRVATVTQGGRFEGKDFFIGLFKVGRKASDNYTPEGSPSIFVKRGEGGYEILKLGKVVARILHDKTILDRDGQPWGKVTNEWEKVTGPNDLLDLVAGLHHFSDLLR